HVVGLVGESVATSKIEAFAKAFREACNESVVFAFVPWSKSTNWTSREGRQELSRSGARLKCDVRFANTEHVVHVAVIEISRHDNALAELTLHADAVAGSERRLERTIDVGREK